MLPTGLGAHYAAARKNPELVSLREDIALVDARTFELLEQLARGESPAAWRKVAAIATELDAAVNAFHAARRTVNAQEMGTALLRIVAATKSLTECAECGVETGKAWVAINRQITLHRKLVDTEARRAKSAHDVLTKDRALGMLGFIAQSIARNVSNPDEKKRVVEDLRRLTGGETVH